jgi:hypothetical protein
MTEIADATSRQVERQYIDDPYPRWLSLQTPGAATTMGRMSAYFDQGNWPSWKAP